MTEKTLASPKPSEIPIANNFKKSSGNMVVSSVEWWC